MSAPAPVPVPSFDQATRVVWQWDLATPPEALWPAIADTNRLNVLAGLAPVQFTTVRDPDGTSRKIGAMRQFGLPLQWDEHPFEWQQPRHFAVLRVFHGGPVRAYRCRWELAPHGEGTRLTQTFEIVPRGGVPAAAARWPFERTRAGFERAYRRLDAFLNDQAGHPLEGEEQKGWNDAARAIAERLTATGHPRRLVRRLVRLVVGGDDVELQALRPFALADRWGAPRREVLALCLDASAEGLLVRQWSHLCPGCRGPNGTTNGLAALADAAYCPTCDLHFTGRFDESIELSFRPHPDVRAVPTVLYCSGGPGASPHVVVQATLAPGECRTLALTLQPGRYRLGVDRPDTALVLDVAPPDDEAPPVAADVAWEPGVTPAEPPPVEVTGPAVTLALANPDDRPLKSVLQQVGWRDDAVTAAMATALPAFADRLRREVPASDRRFPVALMAFVACRLAPGTPAISVYAEVVHRGGTVTHDAPDGLVAAFYDVADAVEAAAALLMDGYAACVGVDAGACEAVGSDERLVYAGAPVEAAALFADMAGDHELVLGEAIAGHPLVALVLGGRPELRRVPEALLPGGVIYGRVPARGAVGG